MRAITQDRYGPIREVLRLDDIPAPRVTGENVLVRIHAASIHIDDTLHHG